MDPAKKWLYIKIIVGIFVLAGIAVGIYFLVKHFQSSSDDKKKLKVKFSNLADATKSSRLYGADLERKGMTLEKLEYFLFSIQLAQTLSFNDAGGWTNPQNVISFISPSDFNVDENSYATYGYDEAVAETTHYTNLLDDDAVNNLLNLDLTLDQYFLGDNQNTDVDFSYLLVNWMQPIRFQAIANQYNTSTQKWEPVAYTKKGASNEKKCDSTNTPTEYCKYVTTAASSLLSGPSELATVLTNNGGSLLKLFKPIKYSDLLAKDYTLHLLFDPYQNIRAATSGGSDTQPSNMGALQDSAGAFFDVGLMGVTPVLVASDEEVYREQYRIHLGSSVDWDLLLQVYLVKTKDSKNLQNAIAITPTATPLSTGDLRAVDLGYIPKENQLYLPDNAPLGSFMILYTDYNSSAQTYSFASVDQDKPVIANFKRDQISTCAVRCLYLVCGDETVIQQPDSTSTVDTSLLSVTKLNL